MKAGAEISGVSAISSYCFSQGPKGVTTVNISTEKLSLAVSVLGTLLSLIALGASPWILLAIPGFALGQILRLN